MQKSPMKGKSVFSKQVFILMGCGPRMVQPAAKEHANVVNKKKSEM